MSRFNIITNLSREAIHVDKDNSIMQAFTDAGVKITSICGGKGKCGRCKIIIREGRVTPITNNEKDMLSTEEIERGIRLACQTKPLSDLKVEIPLESLILSQRLQTEGEEIKVEVEPIIHKVFLRLDPPTLSDPRPDLTRVIDNINEKEIKRIDFILSKNISNILREKGWAFTLTLYGDEIIGIGSEINLGMAFDIGSTKLAAYLVDLDTGRTLDAIGLINPQVSYGDDIVSRISYAMEEEKKREELRRAIIKGINGMITSLCRRNKIEKEDISNITIVGNTVMHHLLLGLPVRHLGLAPYIPVLKESQDIKTRDLGIDIMRGGYAYLLPLIGGYIGSDHVAMILATRLWENRKKVRIGIDIGTNTEIAFADEKKIVSLSCASGPAFEGYGIKQGVKAVSGAIDGVKIEGNDPVCSTIDNKPAIGICGSGILDAIAELYISGAINEKGRLQESFPSVRRSSEGLEFILVKKEDSGINNDIVVSQSDINSILLAKAAIRAGISIGLKEIGRDDNEIKEIVISGAFGSYINPESAVKIGMLPKIDLRLIKQVGNAAGVGAKLVLISKSERELANTIADNVRYVETCIHPDFTKIFARSMFLPKTKVE
ncbi:ASKHA domain-containing protein [Candidatus Methanoliparum sp. LAM-1]|uniref:ASKHA domain-containing protein n=1 Tax=Candidatus Methanoliparum sp. LAM-1 TaxID=2874846 RepID=UPI001E556F3B|nr:ASKHA domain-containing protein [Candidatus Methanoliparum sp. LAM-1]BDC35330.1 ferredoxin [Candidatus Methanoliparum sp. LAM-1]